MAKAEIREIFVVMELMKFDFYAIDARDHLWCRRRAKLVRWLNAHYEFIVEDDDDDEIM